MVHAHGRHLAGRLLDDDAHAGRPGEHGREIGRCVVPPILLATHQRAGRRRRVRDRGPLDAVHVHNLGAAGPVRLATWTRHVAGEALIDDLRARHALVRLEAERAGADHLGHLLEGVGLGQALRHDRGHEGLCLAERAWQQRERRLEPEHDMLVAIGGQLVRAIHQRAAEGVPLRPAVQGRDAVAGENRLAVVEVETVAEREAPELAVILGREAFEHLRAGAILAVLPEQGIEYEVGVIAGDVSRRPHRVEDGEVGLRDEADHAVVLGAGNARRGERGRRGGHEVAAFHRCPLRCPPQAGHDGRTGASRPRPTARRQRRTNGRHAVAQARPGRAPRLRGRPCRC